jgi:N-acetylglucosaminyl-diphospho-decaprenol L-rhamnosyltransferase
MSVPNSAEIAPGLAGPQPEYAAADRSDPSLDIAVIIVTYRSAQLTIEGLRSLVSERSTPGLRIRAVVVDNASGDMPAITQAVTQNDWSSWVTVVLAPENGGFAYGNNLGIQRAYASRPPSYVYLLNPDAQVRPGAIGSLVRFLEAHSNIGIAGSSFENLDGSDWPIAFRFPTLISELNQGIEFGFMSRILGRWVVARHMPPSNEEVDWICGASMLIRHQVFAAIGGLDENYFLYYEETDFCRRAREAGFPTWYVPESRVMHIAGQSTLITERNAAPKRLPAYWFESRRRYFALTFGTRHAIAIDVVAILANAIGLVKRSIQRRQHSSVPYFIRDLVRHSVMWRRNRSLPAIKSGTITRVGLDPAKSPGQ